MASDKIDYSLLAIPKPTPKKKGGKGPRKSGDRVERLVAKELGGERVPMSGAAKNFATGDVEIKDANGRKFVKLEVKASGLISTSGEKSYILSKNVLDQMVQEAEKDGEVGALVIHFKNQPIEEGYTIMSTKHFKMFLEWAKLGHTQ